MFAMANIADEHNPWAIIIISAPVRPHLVIVRSPATINPM